MVQFDAKRRTLPGLEMPAEVSPKGGRLTRTTGTGDAWLSSVRGLSCSLKWGNERNPYPVLQVSLGTASVQGEEGEDDAKSACPSDALGYTRATMPATMGREAARQS